MWEAERAARQMLSAYPDFGKAPPEYLLTITETVQLYPMRVSRHVCDPVRGLCSHLKWLPTVAEIKEAMDREAEQQDRWNMAAAEKVERRSKAERDRQWEIDNPIEKRRAFAQKLMASFKLMPIIEPTPPTAPRFRPSEEVMADLARRKAEREAEEQKKAEAAKASAGLD